MEELEKQRISAEEAATQISSLETEISGLKSSLNEFQLKLDERKKMEEDLQEARQRQTVAQTENPRLKAEMDELK